MVGSWVRQLGRHLSFLCLSARILFRARSDPPLRPRDLPELPRVNHYLGAELLRPELSGLETRPPGVPQRAMRVLVQIGYRWQPSAEFRQRQMEMGRTNAWARGLRKLWVLPPILAYPEDTDVAPHRVQPLLNESAPVHPLEDLSDLEKMARGAAWIIAPRQPEMDQEDLLLYRPLLPRRYRDFLRYSPYPRLTAAIATVTVATLGVLWITQLQQAEAVAAGKLHIERHVARSALDGARAYGVDPRRLVPLQLKVRALQAAAPPDSIVASRARVNWYRRQAAAYTNLFRVVRVLEREAIGYWAWREGVSYANVVSAVQSAASLGLSASAGEIPACGTPACFRGAVERQEGYAAWLRETVQTLDVYGKAILDAADAAAAAATEVQKAHALAAIVAASRLPISLAAVDRLIAAATPQEEARAGALAHLDADALERRLVRILPAHAIVVSLQDDRISWYARGRTVYSGPISAGPSTPTGVFHIEAKEPSISATYWQRQGSSYRYLPGALPDWMPFFAAPSGSRDSVPPAVALQAAPWRIAFGPGNDGAIASFAPSTPGSIDLPPDVADSLFHWATVGTEVVVY